MGTRSTHWAVLALCAAALLTGCSSSGSSKSAVPSNPCWYVHGAKVTKPARLLVAGARPQRGFTVGFVTDIGGLGDKSFNDLTNKALQETEKRYGIKGTVVQSKSETDYVRNLTELAKRKTGLIVGVGATMGPAVYSVANSFPKEHFALVDASPIGTSNRPVSLPNVANLYFAEQQSGYLAGVVAGLMEKHRVGKATHGTVGFLGGQPILPVNRYIAGYVAGVQCTDQAAKILGGYAGTFADRRRGRSLGQSQVSQGADVLFQVAALSGIGYVDAAKASGVYAIGVDANQRYLGPEMLTTALKRVDVAVRDTIVNAASGHFRSGDQRFSAVDRAIGIAKPAPVVPAQFVKEVDRFQRLMMEGKVAPPTSVPSH